MMAKLWPFSLCVERPVKSSLETRLSRISCRLSFPMYCVQLSVALEMESVEPHEVLLARGALVEHDLHDIEPVIFVSHQWVSTKHPDPEATQFAVFQRALRKLLAGYQVRSDWMHSVTRMKDEVCDSWPILLENALVWYDFFSVPQDASDIKNTLLAIQSIPAYIEMSTFTFVLAPSVDHTEFIDDTGEALSCDYYSWQRRGWCKLELLASYLKVNAQSPVVIRSESYMHFATAARVASQSSVAEGEFSCCRMDHERIHPDGTASPIPCDKLALFGVVGALVRRRLSYELRQGNVRVARQIKAYSHIWSCGLGGTDNEFNDRNNTLDIFLKNYAFTTPHVVDGGWTPLRFACVGGNVNAVRQLLEESADPEAYLESPSGADFPLSKGSSILSHVILICCCSEHEEILDLLVAHKANLDPPKHMSVVAIASCTASFNKRGSRWFLRNFPDYDLNSKSVNDIGICTGRWPLYVTLCTSADFDYVRLLCERNADVMLQSWPLSHNAFHLACTLCPTSSPDIAEYILQKMRQRREEDGTKSATDTAIQPIHNEANRRLGMTMPWWIHMHLKAKRAMNIEPREITMYSLRCIGSTPLLLAASEGKDRVCRWLLDQKADATIGNMNGETALSLAQERGFQRVVDVLTGMPVCPVKNERE